MRSNNARTAAHNNSHSDSAPEKHHANFFDLPYRIFLMLLMVCFLVFEVMANFGFQSRLALSVPFFVLYGTVSPVHGVAPPLGATLARPKKKVSRMAYCTIRRAFDRSRIARFKEVSEDLPCRFLIRKKGTKSGILGLYEQHPKTCKLRALHENGQSPIIG